MRNLMIKLTLLSVVAMLPMTAADKLSGTWKMNPAKSKYSPGPAPKAATTTYSMDGEWTVLKTDTVAADGKTTSSTNRYKTDGKDYPWQNPLIPGATSISVKAVDDYTRVSTMKRDGKVVTTIKSVISKDGKTRTMTSEGVNAEGKKVHNVIVYDRQ